MCRYIIDYNLKQTFYSTPNMYFFRAIKPEMTDVPNANFGKPNKAARLAINHVR